MESIVREIRSQIEAIDGDTAEARKGNIGVYTYGPCTLPVSRQRWLERVDQNGSQVSRLATFRTPEQM